MALNLGVPDRPGTALVNYDAARAALAAAHDVDEVIEIRDKAEAMRVYARLAKDVALERWAVEIRLRAERAAGRLLAAMEKHQPGPAAKDRSEAATEPPTLAELGIKRNQSANWQLSAALPEAEFEAYLGAHGGDKMPSSSGLRNLVKIRAAKESNAALLAAPTGGTIDDLEALAFDRPNAFAAILVDVPSEYRNFSESGGGRSPEMHYSTMTVDELIAMGPIVRALAAKHCALFYWTSGPNLRNAFKIVEAWGNTRYSTTAFTWVKTNPKVDLGVGFTGLHHGGGVHLKDFHRGNGHWTAANPEVCLLFLKGHPLRLDKGVDELVIAPLGRHSAKPEEVRARIERLVGGPYLELFARDPRKGWTVWGNQVSEDTPLRAELAGLPTVAAGAKAGDGPGQRKEETQP